MFTALLHALALCETSQDCQHPVNVRAHVAQSRGCKSLCSYGMNDIAVFVKNKEDQVRAAAMYDVQCLFLPLQAL